MAQLMLDSAYWDARILDAARQTGADAIAGYVYDHYLNDSGGYCGGWSPAAIQSIYAAGLDFHPIFVFRDGEAAPTPERCLAILAQLGVRAGAWVHNDLEGGAMDSQAHAVALNQALRAAGHRPAPYGLQSTLNAGYLAYADGAWVANYLGLTWDRIPPLTNVPNVGAWDFIGWQYCNSTTIAGVDVDVSVHSFPASGGGKGAPPPVPNVTDSVTPSQPVSGKAFHDAQAYDWNTLQPAGTVPSGTGVTWTEAKLVDGVWYDHLSGGTWCLKDADIDDGGFDPTHFRPSPAPAPAPPPTPAPAGVSQEAFDALVARVIALEKDHAPRQHGHTGSVSVS